MAYDIAPVVTIVLKSPWLGEVWAEEKFTIRDNQIIIEKRIVVQIFFIGIGCWNIKDYCPSSSGNCSGSVLSSQYVEPQAAYWYPSWFQLDVMSSRGQSSHCSIISIHPLKYVGQCHVSVKPSFIMLSPQYAAHPPTPLHVALHPSPSTVFPSSHTSQVKSVLRQCTIIPFTKIPDKPSVSASPVLFALSIIPSLHLAI